MGLLFILPRGSLGISWLDQQPVLKFQKWGLAIINHGLIAIAGNLKSPLPDMALKFMPQPELNHFCGSN